MIYNRHVTFHTVLSNIHADNPIKVLVFDGFSGLDHPKVWTPSIYFKKQVAAACGLGQFAKVGTAESSPIRSRLLGELFSHGGILTTNGKRGIAMHAHSSQSSGFVRN